MTDRWPDIPYEPWKDRSETLHQWRQIVGKFRLARTPWLNHSWYDAAARLSDWDREALECPQGVPRVPRVVLRGSQ